MSEVAVLLAGNDSFGHGGFLYGIMLSVVVVRSLFNAALAI